VTLVVEVVGASTVSPIPSGGCVARCSRGLGGGGAVARGLGCPLLSQEELLEAPAGAVERVSTADWLMPMTWAIEADDRP
jgi:hypothetical protein